MNTDEIFQKALTKVNESYAVLLKHVSDPKFLNWYSQDFQGKKDNWEKSVKELFQAKLVIHNALSPGK